MTGAIIPDDWDGVTWIDKRVTAPDSAKWLSIVRGNLTRGQSPFFWDVDSGSVEDATNTAEEIESRSTADNLFPADIAHVQDLKLYTRSFGTTLGEMPISVPVSPPLLLASSTSLVFPSARVSMDFTSLFVFSAPSITHFRLDLKDGATGSLFLTDFMSIPSGAFYVHSNVKSSWDVLHQVGYTFFPRLELSAQSFGAEFWYLDGWANLAVTFDLSGNGIDVG